MTEEGERQEPPSLGEYAGERDMERFWREVKPVDEPMRRAWFLPSILVLMALSVPWYLPAGGTGRFFGGLPLWIWTALGCSVLIAGLTCYVAMRAWRDDG